MTKSEATITMKKEMGITHKDFYAELPNLLNDSSYTRSGNTIKFQFRGKDIEISLGPETIRELGTSVRLPLSPVTFKFFSFTEQEVNDFIKHFNLIFMRGGG